MRRQLKKLRIWKPGCLCLLIIFLAGMGAGCWNRTEIEQLGFVTIVGIDTAGPQDVLVTIQIALPRMLTKGTGGGGVSGKAFFNASVRARNVSDAVRLFSEEDAKLIRFKQLSVIIVGEDLARRGVLADLDFFTRKAQLRRSIWVVAAKGRAADLMIKGGAIQDPLPSKYIRTILERKEILTGTRYPVNLAQFMSMVTRPGIDALMSSIELTPILSGLSPTEKKDAGKEVQSMAFAFRGAGVFKKDKLVFFLGPSETRGVRWLQGKVAEGGTITVPVDSQGTWASLVIQGESTKVTPIVRPDGIRFQVEIKEQGYISSIQRGDLDVSQPKYVRLLEQEREKAIRREAMAAIKKSQKLHSDFIGFGEKIYETNPSLWNQIEKDWDDQWLPDLSVDLKVSCQIKHTGLTAEPAKPIL
jgi:spore germination protein KC